MIVVSVNIRFGGRKISRRATSIMSSVRAKTARFFDSALVFVQECSPSAMAAIERIIGATHKGFARSDHATMIGPFVATFVPHGSTYEVAWFETPHTTMGRDYHSVVDTRDRSVAVYNVHLDSCAASATVRDTQAREIVRDASRFAMLGDLNERAKFVARGVRVQTRSWYVPATDHKARVYKLAFLREDGVAERRVFFSDVPRVGVDHVR
jgi:hypothetical protein